MKKLIFLGLGSALIFTVGGVGTAQADNGPHTSTAGLAGTSYTIGATTGSTRCAGCHRTHTAKAALLLKAAQPALCYTCHGGGNGANTDVQNGTSGSVGAALRGGGFEYALIGAGEAVKTLGALDPVTGRIAHSAVVPKVAAEATTSKHQIDGVTAGTMWGNGAISAISNLGKAAVTLECGSCHDPHGNGNYRILKPLPADAGVAAKVLSAPGVLPVVYALLPGDVGYVAGAIAPVNIPDAYAKNYTTTDYWSVVDRQVPVTKNGPALLATETDGYIANASQWCSTCHTRYLAKAPDYETNSGDGIFAYRHTSGRVDKAGVERPNCIQCHVSHGSNAVMTGASVGLNPGDTAPAAGDSRLLRIDQRGVCVACHNV